MKAIKHCYVTYFGDKAFIVNFVVSVVFLIFAIIMNFLAGIYATERASNAVTDIILSNVPVFDIDWFFLYGPLLLWGFVFVLLLYRPNKFPFTLKSIALLVLIRSFFVTLTHIGPFPTHTDLEQTNILAIYLSGSDLFFSGHTGLPFLMALVFWDNPRLRHLFILMSVLFGIVVLLGHLHYSIDVLAAFFITYTVFHLCTIFFRRDLALFKMEGV